MEDLLVRVQSFLSHYSDVDQRLSLSLHSQASLTSQLEGVKSEQGLLERAREAMQVAKSVLTKSSLESCEGLANMALQSIFGFPYKVKYSMENNKFVLDKGEFCVDLATAEGGGLITVVSFVFSLYLVMKQGVRRVLLFDEQFTQISDAYMPNFLEFVRYICRELDFEILLVTHDERIAPSVVDRAYYVENGTARLIYG